MVKLKKLSLKDNCYDLLQHIGPNENLFINEVFGESEEFYLNWVNKMLDWDKEKNLPEGYVRQTIYLLYLDDTPIGIGKLRHKLSNKTREYGGNIGYAIDERYRGKGFGKVLFKKLISKAKQLGISELVATVEKDNLPSTKIVKDCGGKVIYENEKRCSYVLY